MAFYPRCFIFAAGPFHGLIEKPASSDYVIAADGGYRWCVQEYIAPDILVGDFDSLETIPKGLETRSFPVEKDDTDTMLAIKTGLEQGHREFHIYGGIGGRLDHTIANLQALLYLAKEGAQGYLYGKQETLTAIKNGQLLLQARNSGTFSVFCFGTDATGVTIHGAQYPLSKHTLTAEFPLGVSNHFIGQPVTISVESGCLVISWNHK